MGSRTAKNLLGNRDQYNKYYGDFRGVDFSSDHTRVHDQRFSYAVNVYKDYQSAQGHAIETIPGFRVRAEFDGEIFGIHTARFLEGTNAIAEKVLVHHGKTLSLCNLSEDDAEISELSSGLAENKSTSFFFNNRLYIMDGTHYIYYDGETVKNVADEAYVPTTRINIVIGGENADYGEEYEQRNLLSTYFKQHFKISAPTHTKDLDGVSLYAILLPNERAIISDIDIVTPEGTEIEAEINTYKSRGDFEVFFAGTGTGFSFEPEEGEKYKIFGLYDDDSSKCDYVAIVVRLEDSEAFVGGEVTITYNAPIKNIAGVSTVLEGASDVIKSCTISTVYNDRIFVAGNPKYPNHIFWCSRNSSGFTDPSYFGVLNYQQDGVDNSPVTAMMTVADTLVVLKSDTQQDGSVYYHRSQLTGDNVVPVTFPSEHGLHGIGCLGACVNFFDDPIFISRLGVEGIGQLSVRYERAIEHRSSLIDAKLLSIDLKNAVLEEWNGYLVLLADGKIFLADSRQRYTHETGVMQYEWYYLEEIGVYSDQSLAEDGSMIGGTFAPAKIAKTINNNLYFATKTGHLCSFNFDKRNEYYEIPTEYYDFNGRTIFSAVATKMDCCDIPHLTKHTVNKSTVIKTKELIRSAAKIAVRTNKVPMQQIARINSSVLNFEDIDFADFTVEETLFAVREKERNWVEKQYYIYSDEFRKPFALFNISYRYTIGGRIKS